MYVLHLYYIFSTSWSYVFYILIIYSLHLDHIFLHIDHIFYTFLFYIFYIFIIYFIHLDLIILINTTQIHNIDKYLQKCSNSTAGASCVYIQLLELLVYQLLSPSDVPCVLQFSFSVLVSSKCDFLKEIRLPHNII